MNKIRYALYRFMYGRNGYDDLARALLGVTFVFCIVGIFFSNRIWNLLVWVLLIYNTFRVFSKNILARRKENEKFLYFVKPYQVQWENRKTHKVFRCQSCGQIIRVPKGKGSIEITCPKCRTKITKRT